MLECKDIVLIILLLMFIVANLGLVVFMYKLIKDMKKDEKARESFE